MDEPQALILTGPPESGEDDHGSGQPPGLGMRMTTVLGPNPGRWLVLLCSLGTTKM
jgi:hypothetical protein